MINVPGTFVLRKYIIELLLVYLELIQQFDEFVSGLSDQLPGLLVQILLVHSENSADFGSTVYLIRQGKISCSFHQIRY